jgi:hypothetical protein
MLRSRRFLSIIPGLSCPRVSRASRLSEGGDLVASFAALDRRVKPGEDKREGEGIGGQ